MWSKVKITRVKVKVTKIEVVGKCQRSHKCQGRRVMVKVVWEVLYPIDWGEVQHMGDCMFYAIERTQGTQAPKKTIL